MFVNQNLTSLNAIISFIFQISTTKTEDKFATVNRFRLIDCELDLEILPFFNKTHREGFYLDTY